MQKRSVKIITLIFVFIFLDFTAKATSSTALIQSADSLFINKRFTQALQLYEQVYSNSNYTPSMLLKMAYIHEGLGDIAKTQYFLQVYFLATNDHSVLDKSEEVAKKYGLEGYSITTWDRFRLLLIDYRTVIISVMMMVVLLFLGLVVYMSLRNQRLLAPISAVLATSIVLVFFLQLQRDGDFAILNQPNIYLMSGPSVGANVVEIVDAGHKVEVVETEDVWLKVIWQQQHAYVKSDQVQYLKY